MRAGRGAVDVVAPFFGFGVFVMLQRQMIGIRDRAERLARGAPAVEPEATTPAGDGHQPEKVETELIASAG